MKFAYKAVLATATAVLSLVVVPAASQSALAAPSPSLAASNVVANKVESTVTALIGTPSGCVSGNFCVYTQGNGGDLCLSNSGNSNYWGNGCANNDQTLFNNGTSGLGVNIYYHQNHKGAFACLSRGDYWLYADQQHFSHVGDEGTGTITREGLNQKVGNNAASHKWSTVC